MHKLKPGIFVLISVTRPELSSFTDANKSVSNGMMGLEDCNDRLTTPETGSTCIYKICYFEDGGVVL